MEKIHQEKKHWVGYDIDIHEHLQIILKGEKDECGHNIVCYDTRWFQFCILKREGVNVDISQSFAKKRHLLNKYLKAK
jgi:hypothetical protein